MHPRLRSSTLFALAATLLICIPVWPGLMSFDSLYAYKQSVYGVETALWPPVHDYLFYVSRKLTGGPGGLFAAQIFALFGASAVIIAMYARTSLRYWLGISAFLLAFFWFPTLLGTAIVNWKDVSLTCFSVVAFALWLAANERGSTLFLVLAAVALGLAVSVRLNGLALVLPLIVVWLVFPTNQSGRRRAIGAGALGLSLLTGYASTVWRLPDLKRLPAASDAFALVQLWDLVGLSACANEVLLPASLQARANVSAAELRMMYDPRHINLTLNPTDGRKALPGLEPGEASAVATEWKAAVRRHPLCYLKHRVRVFLFQMGMTPTVFYPTHDGIDANEFGIAPSHQAATEREVDIIKRLADWWPMRAFWLYLLAGAACLVAYRSGNRSTRVLFMMAIGAVLYVGSFFFPGPAADARYIFPSNVFCALTCVIAIVASERDGHRT